MQLDSPHSRATALYAALRRHFAAGRAHLYRPSSPPTGPAYYAYLWDHSRVLVGALALAMADPAYRPAAREALDGLRAYWAGRAYASAVVDAGGGDNYTDDNAWIALALIQARRLELPSSLERVGRILRFARACTDTNPRTPRSGGIYWVEQGRGLGLSNHDRGAGTTAGHACVALHLRELTGGTPDVATEQLLDWVLQHLDSAGTGAGPFWNAVRADGSIDTNLWVYNQGVMLAARVLQYRLTAQPTYLEAARAIAATTERTFGDFTRQPPSFVAMYVQHLLMLHAIAPDPHYLELSRAYADWTWSASGARDPRTNLFTFDDAGRPAPPGSQPVKLQDQAALLQLHALLACPPTALEHLA